MDRTSVDRLLTANEYVRLAEDGQRHELQGGVLVAEPQAFPRHAQIQARLAHSLFDFVSSRRLGVVLTEGGFLLSQNPDTIRAPDVSFVRADRFDPDEAARRFFPGAPDLAIEILSPSNRPAEIHAKVADFLAAGSRLVWVIDPDRRVASVYRTLLSPRRVGAGGTLDGEDVLPGFSLALEGLLAR
jgi:Uma2 family endonuclease